MKHDTTTFERPDGKCHAAAALVDGCDEPVPEGMWSCDRHAVETWKRGQELIAKAERERPLRGSRLPQQQPGKDRSGLRATRAFSSPGRVTKGRGNGTSSSGPVAGPRSAAPAGWGATPALSSLRGRGRTRYGEIKTRGGRLDAR